jgi:phosphate starvation-inducible PhoH-like protein
MSRKPVPAQAGERARIEVLFDKPQLLGRLFGEYDQNLIAIESRLGVYISARGNKLVIEGLAESIGRARDVLTGLYNRIAQGQEIDTGAVEAVIAMASEPTLDGIIRQDVSQPPAVMIRTRKKTIVPRSATQIRYMEALARDEIVFALGPAGTGKTYLAIAKAVEALESGKVSRIVLSRPAVEAGESLGFLPGDLQEKLAPYLRPLYDALTERLGTKRLKAMLADGIIEIAPVAYMRGRTLSECFVVIDEAQNCTYTQIKMLLTRLGWRSTMVLTGDPDQTDLLPGISGLADIANRLEKVPEVPVVRLAEGDIVRHPLVASMLTVL